MELTDRSVSDLASGIRARRFSSTEVVSAFLDRIARVDPTLNAVCELDPARARQEAARADAAVARRRRIGPLHGVPVLLKDSHRVAGFATVVGNSGASRLPARADGAVAALLRQAGAILMGKTNAATDLADFQTNNPVFGRTNNPWDPERTAGGSSGGAAAAVAAGLSPVDIGSDIAGSIRVPAHFTGIFGLKPTAGAISARGHVTEPTLHPRGGGLGSLVTIGPLARDPADLDLLLGILARSSGRRPTVRRGTTLGLLPTMPDLRVAAAISTALLTAGAAAEHAGLRVQRVEDPPSAAAQHAAFVAAYRAAARSGSSWRRDRGLVATQARVREAWDVLLRRYEAIVLPVAMCTAFSHRATGSPIEVDGIEIPYWGISRLTEPFNLTGHPAIAVPFAQDADGMPIGIQVVARHGWDRWLIQLAALLAREGAGARRPSLVPTGPSGGAGLHRPPMLG